MNGKLRLVVSKQSVVYSGLRDEVHGLRILAKTDKTPKQASQSFLDLGGFMPPLAVEEND